MKAINNDFTIKKGKGLHDFSVYSFEAPKKAKSAKVSQENSEDKKA